MAETDTKETQDDTSESELASEDLKIERVSNRTVELTVPEGKRVQIVPEDTGPHSLWDGAAMLIAGVLVAGWLVQIFITQPENMSGLQKLVSEVGKAAVIAIYLAIFKLERLV